MVLPAHYAPLTALFALALAHAPRATQAIYLACVTLAILQTTISQAQDQSYATSAQIHSATVSLVP